MVGTVFHVLLLLRAGFLQIFQLRLENVLRGSQPADPFVRIVFTQFESNEGLAGTGGVDDGSLAGLCQHLHRGLIRYSIVFKQFDSHMPTL